MRSYMYVRRGALTRQEAWDFRKDFLSINGYYLIHDRSVDKIRGKTAPIARKRDAAVLDVPQGALTRREAWDFREDVYT